MVEERRALGFGPEKYLRARHTFAAEPDLTSAGQHACRELGRKWSRRARKTVPMASHGRAFKLSTGLHVAAGTSF